MHGSQIGSSRCWLGDKEEPVRTPARTRIQGKKRWRFQWLAGEGGAEDLMPEGAMSSGAGVRGWASG